MLAQQVQQRGNAKDAPEPASSGKTRYLECAAQMMY
jgi:hypothetical protein